MLLSFIIPVYNQEGHLKKALSSVIDQTGIPADDSEIIIIDDHSTDRSVSLSATLLAQRPNVRIIPHDRSQGLWASRCQGISLAQGRYVLFVDPREWLDAETGAILLQAAADYNVDMVQMLRKRVVKNIVVSSAKHPDASFNERISGADFRKLASYVGVDSCITPFCGDKLYRADLLRMAARNPFPARWGEVQMLNIHYMRCALSAVLLDYAGVNADWSDNYENYKVRRLEDVKRLYYMKKLLCADRESLKTEMRRLLRYHISQLLEELAWTPDAVAYFMRNELADPVWAEVGETCELGSLIAEGLRNKRSNQWKTILKRAVK